MDIFTKVLKLEWFSNGKGSLATSILAAKLFRNKLQNSFINLNLQKS